MKRKWLRNSIMSATVLAMTMQTGYISIMPESSTSYAAEAALASKTVRLSESSTLFIRDARFLMQEKGLLLAYTVTITNNGSSELDLTDYWIRVKSKSGERFNSKISNADKSITKVAPRSSVNVTYTAIVSSTTKLSDLIFEVSKIDFNVAGYERPLGTIQYPQDAAGSTPVFQPNVMIMNNTKIKGAVKQYYAIKNPDGFYLTISFLLENVGYSGANLSNLGFALQTASYSVFDVNADSLAQLTVQPKERKIVTIQAKLPNAVAGKPLVLVPYTLDSSTNEKLPHGQFEIPAVTPLAPAASGIPRNVYIGGQLIETVAGGAFVNDSGGERMIDIEFKLNNKGAEAVQLPELQFMLRSENGVHYPLSYDRGDDGALLPGIEQTIMITGQISNQIQPEKAQLIVTTKGTDGREGYHIGEYALKSATQAGSVGGSFTYNSAYKIQLDSIHRTPLEDSDMLIAKLTVTNTDSTAKSVPSSLSGYFLINDVKVESEYQTVGLDRVINIAPNSTYQLVVYTKIPYTTVINSVGFVLTDKVDENRMKSLFQFSSASISPVQKIGTNLKYDIQTVGSRGSVKIIDTQVYSGESNQYFFAEIELTNNEARSSQPAELTGYLIDGNERLVPVMFTTTDQKVASGGRMYLSAYAVAGKTFDMSDFEFVMGQAVSHSSGGNESDKILVNPVSHQLRNADKPVKSDFADVRFGPYHFTFRNILATLNVAGLYDVTGVKLELSYDMEIDESYDVIAGEHQLVFEFVDQDPAKATYEKAFKINAKDDDQVTLKPGEFIDLQIVYDDRDVQSKVNNYRNYKLNIYGMIDDTKILLASKELRWFTRE